MGYYKEGTITHFEPDNDENTLYIRSGCGELLSDIIDQAKEYFGKDIELNQLRITSEFIHTRCIYYDCYDHGDRENFIIIERIK